MTGRYRFHISPSDPEFTCQKLLDNDQTVTFEKEQTSCRCVLWGADGHARGSCHSSREKPPREWRAWPVYRCSAGGFQFQRESLSHPAWDLCSRSSGTGIPCFQLTATSLPKTKETSSMNILNQILAAKLKWFILN